MIALFFATQRECELIVEKLDDKNFFSVRSIPFIKGKIKNSDLIICISGIGKASASISSVICFEKFPIKGVIISGIAGAYPSSGLEIGSIAVAEKEIFADEGLLIKCENTDDSFIFLNSEEFSLYMPEFLNNLPKGAFLTVSCCTGNLKRAKFLEKKFNAICENMEGAAVAKVAQIYKTPCIEIRSISNMVTDRAETLSFMEVSKASLIVQNFIIEHFHLFEQSF
ncbi:futalosine hydrolase [Thermodesulfovibrio aggregans]|uniref:Futalosine hydrolase n=1 Tax=Thermodesulfovibrio aggregans TaxID=86166 RepID=A0A0U9HYE3_9BACT|nr:futalosine hydrolase [Thermodesulfovibrio aggregans]